MDEPMVSIVIRVRDEASALGRVLQAVRHQMIGCLFEIVVLDNGSVDDSDRVALRHDARVFRFPRELFGYGRALNLGTQLSRGQIVVFLSAHSIPQHRQWLAELIRPVLEQRAGAVFCRQVPAGPVSRLEHRRFSCFPAGDTVTTTEGFIQACRDGGDPYEAALFSNSACAIRRDVAARHLFRDLLYAEDRAFAVDYLMSGGAVAYVHASVVSYDRPATWSSGYRIGYRAQVSKRLIRELTATYTGARYDSRWETLSRAGRAALVVPGLLGRLLLCLREPHDLRTRAARYAFKATGATLGMAKGSLRWRRHMDTLGCDTALLHRARGQCVPVVPKTLRWGGRDGT